MMRLWSPLLRAAFAALTLCWAGNAAQAQSLVVAPINVQLAPGQKATALTITNQSPDIGAFQVRAYEWQVVDGQDQLTPTDKIILSPPLGNIQPQGSQLVRLVLRAVPTDHEETYRIWLDQIPPPSQPGSVRIALRLSIPVFAVPATRVTPDLHWQLTRTGGTLRLIASNSGTQHQAVRKLTVTAADGTALKVEGGVSPYILAGASRSWTLAVADGKPVAAGPLHLTAATDNGTLDQTVTAGAGTP